MFVRVAVAVILRLRMFKMPLIRYYVFLLILAGLTRVFCTVDFARPIKSFINFLNIPVKVSVLICWDYDLKYDFLIEFHQPFSHEMDNFQVLIKSNSIENIPNADDEHRHLIIVDLNCAETSKLLQEAGSKLAHRFKWIIISTNQSDAAKIFQSLPLFVNSEVYFVTRVNEEFIFEEAYRTSLREDIIFNLIASYRNRSIEDRRAIFSVVQRRKQLSGTTLRASLVITNNDTINHLHDYKDKHIDTITKVNFLLTNHLMNYLNASIQYKLVSQWGYLDNQTGQWSGMIGDLVENRSDIGATALFFTSDRIKYVEYITMPSPTLSKFVFRSPKLSYTEDLFLLPFHKFVWYCLIALFFIAAFTLVGTVFAEWRLFNSQDDISNASLLKPSFHDSIVVVLTATCQQGSAVAPKSFTSRIVMVVTYITLMFLYTSYSANIVALLQSPSTKIRTLEDLLHSRLKFGADDTIFNHYYFSHATEPTRRQIYEQKILQKNGSDNFMSLAEGVEKILHGLFAFHMELGVGYKLMGETYQEHEKCGLQEIQYLQVIDPWYAIQKNSSYKELLKTGMFRLREYGLQSRENSRLYTKKPKCNGGGGKFTTASLVDIRSALLMLFLGFGTSLGVLILETVFYILWKRQAKD